MLTQIMKITSVLCRPFVYTALLATLAATAVPSLLNASETVGARYLQSAGDTVRLQLIISSPAPQKLILEQHLPPGTRVISSSPAARKINTRTGMVKWLFTGVSPGRIDVTMQVAPASAVRAVSGNIRYRDSSSGGLQVIHIAP